MRVVVVGATGNVGTSVVKALGRESRVTEIVGVARRPAGWNAAKATFVTADIAGDDLRPYFEGADAVVHLAWLFQPTHDPMTTWQVNVGGSIRVFEAVAAAQVPILVYASSVGAYSPAPDRTVDETWATDGFPTAGYGREKAYVERILDIFEARHPEVRTVRFRPAFIFQRPAATEQRRLFAGPLVPRLLLRPGRLPLLPHPAGLRFQALHAVDVADAYRRAVVDDGASGAYNLAAEPVIDPARLGDLVGARPVELPRPLVRSAMAAAWHLRLIPADPALLDLALRLPLLDSTRARRELGWNPTISAVDALREVIDGMADGAGAPTPPLAPDSLSNRLSEVRSGIGGRAM